LLGTPGSYVYYLLFLVDNQYRLYKSYGDTPPTAPFSLDLGTLLCDGVVSDVLAGLTLTCTEGDPWDQWSTCAWGFTWTREAQETGLDWVYRYELPDDCIAPREVWSGTRAPRADQRITFEVQASENSVGQALLTDQLDPYLRYSKLVSTPASWPPLFVEALAWTLALRPEQVGYWIEGARMLAFDVPQWSGGDALQRRRALEEALRLLAVAEIAHPMAGVIPLEIGWLRGWELGDLEGAERALARAARLGSSARQAERLRARVLERLSPSEDAKRAWKTGRQIHPPMVPGARLGSEP
jgi:hypothetical protein